MKKYTFTRSAIIQETYVIEAETEAEATAIIHESPDQPVVDSEFLDWYTDYFVLESEDTVCMDCLSHIPKQDAVVTTAGRIVCEDCTDNTI